MQIPINVVRFVAFALPAVRSTLALSLVTRSGSMRGSVNIALSVDGFIATKSGGIEWLNDQPTIAGEDFGFQAFLDSVDVMIMGQKTFAKVLSLGKGMWAYGDKRIVVLSQHKVDIPQHLEKSVTSSAMTPIDLFKELEEQGFQHAYIDGGFTIRQFMKSGLIQRLHLTRVPLLLGDGIPLFSDQGEAKLLHVETIQYPNGMVTTVYDVADGK